MKLTWPRLSKPIRVAGCLLALSPVVFTGLSVCSDLRKEATDTLCYSHQKELRLALSMYAQDYDDHLPFAPKWMEAADPYVMDNDIRNNNKFCCPSLNNVPGEYGYAFNSLLDSKLLSKIQNPENTPILFDSDWLWRDAHAPGLTSIPNPARHYYQGVDCVTYADGHTKFIKPPALPVKPTLEK